jgi:hypothetical protein
MLSTLDGCWRRVGRCTGQGQLITVSYAYQCSTPDGDLNLTHYRHFATCYLVPVLQYNSRSIGIKNSWWMCSPSSRQERDSRRTACRHFIDMCGSRTCPILVCRVRGSLPAIGKVVDRALQEIDLAQVCSTRYIHCLLRLHTPQLSWSGRDKSS